MRGGTKDVFSTFINQAWRIVAGPVVLFLIPLYLTSDEQGYWYTFTSLAALSVFADLGFGAIVLQFAAHEFSSLHFEEGNRIVGSREHIRRLASFFRFTIKWGTRVVFLAFPLISAGGYIFLSTQGSNNAVEWQGVWLLYSCASALVFFNNIVLTFFEGCNSVAKLQTIRFKMAVSATCFMIAFLLAGLGLKALLASICANGFAGVFFLLRQFKYPMIQLWNESKSQQYNWWPEFSALMWRYALSWCSGYFALNVYTPIAFYFYGAAEAGRVGLSMAMWTAGFSIASCWMTAKVPQLNMLIERKEWHNLDNQFQKCFARSAVTMVVGGIAFLAAYAALADKITVFQRILGLSGMTILFLCWLGQLCINNWAIYLRAHKKEPLVKFSIINSMAVFAMTLICAHVVSVDYLFLGFLAGIIIGVPFVWKMYKNQRTAHFVVTGE